MKFVIDKELLRDTMRGIKNFTTYSMGQICMDFEKNGLIMSVVDGGQVSMMIVAISKKAMTVYPTKDLKQLYVTDDFIEDIISFSRVCIDGDKDRKKHTARQNRYLKEQAKKASEGVRKEAKVQAELLPIPDVHDITLEFDNEINELRMSMGNLNKKVKYPILAENTNASSTRATATSMYGQLEKIGELKDEGMEEMINYMKAVHTCGEGGDKVVTFIKDEERFEIESEVEDNDFIIMDLSKPIKKQMKGELKVKMQTENLQAAMACMKKMATKMTIYGKSNFPMLFSASGNDPATADSFGELVDFWYIIAPRIETD